VGQRRSVAQAVAQGQVCDLGEPPLRHTEGMATEPSRFTSADRFSVAELSVRDAESDLL
jgi:hypothetical protein